MSTCYPTGCPPCTSPIDFPENPADGDKYCVVIDDTGKQKCWVWDKCVPGWRAEGQTDSPVKYRGGIDLTRSRASQYPEITAGDFFVVTVDANASTPSNYPGLSATVKAGERVVWSGTDWQLVLPIVAYADDALGDVPLVEDPDADDFGKPVDDTRMGGIVKNATASQAKAGTDKCDTITPYTLKIAIDDALEPISDSIPDVYWELNPDDKLAPIDGSKEVLISNFTTVNDNQSISGKLQIGSILKPITDVDDPAANDGRLTLTEGTIKIEDVAPSIPAGEQRFCVFDENGYILPGNNPADIVTPGPTPAPTPVNLKNTHTSGIGRENDTRQSKAANIASYSGLNTSTARIQTVISGGGSPQGNVNAIVQIQAAGIGAFAFSDTFVFARAQYSGSSSAIFNNPTTVNFSEVNPPDSAEAAEIWTYHATGGSSGFYWIGANFASDINYLT